jgi:hypothetical protein
VAITSDLRVRYFDDGSATVTVSTEWLGPARPTEWDVRVAQTRQDLRIKSWCRDHGWLVSASRLSTVTNLEELSERLWVQTGPSPRPLLFTSCSVIQDASDTWLQIRAAVTEDLAFLGIDPTTVTGKAPSEPPAARSGLLRLPPYPHTLRDALERL